MENHLCRRYLVIIASMLYFAKRRWLQFLSILLCFLLVLSWWLTLKPSNNQPWQADVSKLASIENTDNHAIIHNFRQCSYQTELDYTCTWSTLDVDLTRIQGVDLFMNYWGSPWIAHTIVSFDSEVASTSPSPLRHASRSVRLTRRYAAFFANTLSSPS